MTKEKFLELLAKVDYPWENRGGNIRFGCHCPITAVCAFHFGQSYASDQAEFAAEVIGLSDPDIDDIIESADDATMCDIHLRNRLLRACKLR